MRNFLKILAILALGLIMSLVSGLFIFFTSQYLHGSYSEIIPAFTYWQALGVSVVLSSLLSLGQYSNLDEIDMNPAWSVITAVVISPVLLMIGINYLNNDLFTTLPNISYLQTLLIGIIGFSFSLISWFGLKLMKLFT